MSYRPLNAPRLTPPYSLRGSGSRQSRQTTTSGMPAGVGAVGTAGNPSPQIPGATTGMKKAYVPTPNSGGTIEGNGKKIIEQPDWNYKGPLSGSGAGPGVNTPQAWRGPVRPTVDPRVDPAGESSMPLNRPPQTERANPLTNGGGPPQMEGTSVPVTPPTLNPGKAMGFSQRGNQTPVGDDLNQGTPTSPGQFMSGDPNAPGGQLAPQPGDAGSSPADDLGAARENVQSDLNGGGHTGGVGPYARSFTNPTSAAIYHDYTRQLFGGQPMPQGRTNLTRARGTPQDQSNDDFEGEQAA